MIPIRDHNPTSRRAWVTIALVALNVGVFFLWEPLRADPRDQAAFFFCRAAVPYEVTHGETMLEAVRGEEPSAERPDVRTGAFFEDEGCPDKSVWASVLTSMFLHGGFLHIAGNMLFLWVFGNNVEDRLGAPKYLAFYLACGIAATYAQSYTSPSSATPLIGASGAVAGVLGAYIVTFPSARVTTLIFLGLFVTTMELPALVVLGVWFALQLFQSVGSVSGGAGGGVAYMAHVGGFVAGMLLLLLLRPRPSPASLR